MLKLNAKGILVNKLGDTMLDPKLDCFILSEVRLPSVLRRIDLRSASAIVARCRKLLTETGRDNHREGIFSTLKGEAIKIERIGTRQERFRISHHLRYRDAREGTNCIRWIRVEKNQSAISSNDTIPDLNTLRKRIR